MPQEPLFVKCHRNGGDCYMGYTGQDEATITRLLTELGATGVQFITESEYQAATVPQMA